MIRGCVTTFVIGATHLAVTGHFLAAIHFGPSHRGIGQACEKRRGHPEEDGKERKWSSVQHE